MKRHLEPFRVYLTKDDLVARISFVYLGILIIAVGVILLLFAFVGMMAKVIGGILLSLPIIGSGLWLSSKSISNEYLEIPFWRGGGFGEGGGLGELLFFICNIVVILFAVPVALLLRKLGINGKLR